MSSRKGSGASQLQCSACCITLDGDFISCCHCSKAFHAKKDCCDVAASDCKAILTCDNVTYLCNNCKSYNIFELFERLSAMETEIVNLKKQLSNSVTSEINNIVSEALKEHSDRQERRNNVIAFAIQEEDLVQDDVEVDERNIS